MPSPHIDAISFLAGFLAASLFWWILSKIKRFIPQLHAGLKQRAEVVRERNREGISIYVRQETLRQAQKAHLAHQLFSLDELLIQPRLLAPPDHVLGASEFSGMETIAGQVVPYMPDWPELSAHYDAPTLTVAEAMSAGLNLVVIGRPGSGKTVALAQLASLVSRRDPRAGSLAGCLPVFFHVLDLDLAGNEDQDVVEVLAKLVSSRVPVLLSRRLPKYVREMCSSGKLLLIADGLDEILPEQVGEVLGYLKRLLTRYPTIRIAASASLEHLDGANELNLFPLSMAAWTPADRRTFIEQWGQLWSSHIMPEAGKRANIDDIDPLLIGSWLDGDARCLTPLEWTLITWAVYSGDQGGASALASIQAYADRLNQQCVPPEALSRLAWSFYTGRQTSLHYEQVDQFFSKYDALPASESSAAGDSASLEKAPKDRRAKKTQKISSGSRATQTLAESGLLVEHPNGMVRFCHPLVGGYLASCSADPKQLRPRQLPETDLFGSVLHYMAAQNNLTPWLKEMLRQSDGPLYPTLLMVSRWLKDIPQTVEWRTPVIRKLISVAQNEAVPAGIRARIIAAFYASNDPSMALLFKQLLASDSTTLRRLAALGTGALQEPKAIDSLLGLLGDSSPDVRFAACLAIGAIDSPAAFKTLVDILTSGQEDLQQAAAESLARTAEGQEILKEAVKEDNLLVRRAAVCGLTQIREEWAREILERLTIEDGQWLIRSAANQAVEFMQAQNNTAIRPLPAPHDAPWLVKFASRQGEGISPGQPVTGLLLQALKTGSPEESIAALQYLRDIPEEGVIVGIYEAFYTAYGPIQDAALFALWYLSITGADLPLPAMFGYF